MADLKTFYLGYELKNPIILASCSFGKNVDSIVQAESCGVAAVVLPSLFEEVIKREFGVTEDNYHPEAYDYGTSFSSLVYGATDYINLIKEAKKRVNIPIFASVNCVDYEVWIDFAKSIEDAGADGLELNISYISFSVDDDPRRIEDKYLQIVERVKKSINLPISIKIGSYFSSIPNMVKRLKDVGADGVVLFNRYYQLSYEIDEDKLIPVNYFSTKRDLYNTLRWVGVIHSQIDIDIAATTGIHTTKQVLESIALGANVVQMASAFYRNGLGYAEKLLKEINEKLTQLGKSSLKELRGVGVDTPEEIKLLERVQYMDFISKASKEGEKGNEK